jgi:hypothetical protein
MGSIALLFAVETHGASDTDTRALIGYFRVGLATFICVRVSSSIFVDVAGVLVCSGTEQAESGLSSESRRLRKGSSYTATSFQ